MCRCEGCAGASVLRRHIGTASPLRHRPVRRSACRALSTWRVEAATRKPHEPAPFPRHRAATRIGGSAASGKRKRTQAPGKTCAQATRSRVPTGERRRISSVERSGQRVRARRSATRSDRSSSLRATRSARELGAAHALASVRVRTCERGRTDSFRVVDDDDACSCILLPHFIRSNKANL